MNDTMDQIRLFALHPFNYPKFRDRILKLYLHAFTTGEYAQQIDSQSAERTLDELVRLGTGVMAFTGDKLTGVVLALPLLHDKEFPMDEAPGISMDATIFIAEVMVHAEMRGRGIATEMIRWLLTQAEAEYRGVAIRVWERNQPALSLYDKLGFEPVATISQSKLGISGVMFEMKKIYLYKSLFISQ